MKLHTSGFKNKIKLAGRELDVKVTYTNNDNEILLTSEKINNVTPIYHGNILKSVMKELEIDSKVDIPMDTILNFKFGIKVNDNYEYLNFGNYVVYLNEKQEDTNSYKISCYDKMIYSMKTNEDLGVTYPITIHDYISAICNKLGFVFKNKNETFVNSERVIEKELYVGLDYTYRDILDELAQVTASTICLNANDELEIRYVNNTNDIIDEEYLKDVNVKFGQKYGPINSIVLSRSAESDNVYLRDEESITNNGLCEIKIIDNQIMNWNNRSDYIPEILEKLNGLEYFINDFTSTGICYYDVCDKYSVKIGEEIYSCIMFNDELSIDQGIVENIYTEMPNESITDYKKSDKTDRKIDQVYIIVDKQGKQIEALVSESNETQNSLNDLKEVIKEKESNNHICIEEAHETDAIEYKIKGKCEQDISTQNENLLDLTKSEKFTNDNCQIESMNSNEIKVSYNGTTEAWKNARIGPLKLKDGNYTFSTIASSSNTTYFSYPALISFDKCPKGSTQRIDYQDLIFTKNECENGVRKSLSLTIDNTYDYYIKFYATVGSPASVTNTYKNVMINSGNTLLAYKDFVPDSPSPEYPSEIKNVKGIENLFDNEEYPIISQVAYNASGAPVKWANYYGIEKFFPCDSNKSYTFSNDLSVVVQRVVFYDNEKNIISIFSNTNHENTIVAPNDCSFLRFALNSEKAFNQFQIEEGEIAHSYVPYGRWLKVRINNKQLFNKADTFDGWINNNGGVDSNQAWKSSFLIQVESGKEITWGQLDESISSQLIIAQYNSDGNFIKKNQINDVSKTTLKLEENTQLIRLGYRGDKFDENQLQCQYGKELTEYKEFQKRYLYCNLSKENLFKGKLIAGNISTSNGTVLGDKSFIISDDFIDLKNGNLFTIETKNEVGQMVVYFYTENNAFISAKDTTYQEYIKKYTFSVPDIAKKIKFRFAFTDLENEVKIYNGYYPFYELCSTKDLLIRDELNLVSGELTKKIGKVILDGSENWGKSGNTANVSYYYSGLATNSQYKFSNINISSLGTTSSTNPVPAFCSHFTIIAGNKIFTDTKGAIFNYINETGTIEFRLGFGLNTDITTVELLKEWLSSNPIIVYYVLAKEEHYQLEQTNMPLFDGENHIQLEEDIETDTSIKYYRETPLSKAIYTKEEVEAKLQITSKSILNEVSETTTEIKNGVEKNTEKIGTLEIQANQIEQKVSEIADLLNQETGTSQVEISKACVSNLLKLSIHGQMNLHYLNNDLYLADNLYLLDSYLIIQDENGNKEKIWLPINYLNYLDSTCYDEFITDTDKTQIIRRVGVNSNGTFYKLSNEIIEDYEKIEIPIKEGSSTIWLESFYDKELIYNVKYALKNEYTSIAATKAEMNAAITETSNSIKQEVNANIQLLDGEVKEINGSLELKVNTDDLCSELSGKADDISFVGNRFSWESNYSSMTKDGKLKAVDGEFSGKITADSGDIGGWTVVESGLTNGVLSIRNDGYSTIYTAADIFILRAILQGQSWATVEQGTPEFKRYDLNNDGVINSADLLLLREMINLQ